MTRTDQILTCLSGGPLNTRVLAAMLGERVPLTRSRLLYLHQTGRVRISKPGVMGRYGFPATWELSSNASATEARR